MNCMLSYRIVGDGPPVLLIHGFGISFNIWRNLLPLLKDDFTLIMIELPGIGSSPAPQGEYLAAAVLALEELRVKLKIERWRVFSYSSGTRVGESYVEKYPQRVVNAVFLCPMRTQAYKAFGLKVAKGLDARFPGFGNWVLEGSRLNFLIRLLGFNLRPNDQENAWMDEISSRPLEILKETIRAMPGDGAKEFITPSMPHLFIWGTRDLVTASPRKARAHHRLIDAMHSAPVTAAGQVAELAFPFLSSI